MTPNDTIIRDQQYAAEYDLQAQQTHWFGPEVVFGLAYDLVKPGESLLDLGIGSGLSSILFYKAGLRVYGLDGSSEILEVCRAKHFTVDLKQHDLRSVPLPYPDGYVNHVVSIAVLNSFQDLGLLFEDIARIMLPEGVIAFTVEDQKPGQENSYAINPVEVAEQPDPESAVRLFRHSFAYLTQLLERSGFRLIKKLEFVAFSYPAENRDVFFTAYVAQKK